eukprot:403362056
MSNIFNDTQFSEDFIAPEVFNQTSFSPKKINIDFDSMQQQVFEKDLDFSSNQLFPGSSDPHHTGFWDQNALPSIISRGNSHYEVPIQKKQKLNHTTQYFEEHQKISHLLSLKNTSLFMQNEEQYMLPSTTNSEHQSSCGGKSSIVSSPIEEESQNNATQGNNLMNESQANCLDDLSQNISKSNKRIRKQENKEHVKKREAKESSNQTTKITKKDQQKENLNLINKAQQQNVSKSDKKAQKDEKKSAKSKVQFENEFSSSNDYSGDYDQTFDRLTNKKKEYLQQMIEDRNGVFDYLNDPNEYKRARKRMQNRESAVRSRMRKRNYQDELEDKISDMEQMYKELSEQNAGLAAQNSLLKKQLSFFEDVFAKSSLVGFDQMNSNINRNDLQEFQVNLLKKINARLHSNKELEVIPEDDLMNDDLLSTSRNHTKTLDDFDSISEGNQLDSLRLMRSRSNSSSFSNSGYLFLAMVFCIMCCSSILTSPQDVLNLRNQVQNLGKTMPSLKGRSLLFDETISKKLNQQQQNLASPLTEDELEPENIVYISSDSENSNYINQEPKQFGALELIKMLLAGQYTYITYMIMSTTCFFMWMSPNFNKLKQFFKGSKPSYELAQRSQVRSSKRVKKVRTQQQQKEQQSTITSTQNSQ